VHPSLVVATSPGSRAAAAFQQLRATIEAAGPALKTVGAVAPTPFESTAAILPNLAIALAQNGHSVILVDADPDGATTAVLFEAPVTGESGAAGEESGVPGLSLLSYASLPRPDAAKLLDDLKATVEYVLVRTPGSLQSPTMLTFAPLLDGVVLVLEQDRTTVDEAERAKALLAQLHANVLGIVFTNAAL
jgi:Mrp family chromosome partitioning ATPase